jgi:hypothetical protein
VLASAGKAVAEIAANQATQQLAPRFLSLWQEEEEGRKLLCPKLNIRRRRRKEKGRQNKAVKAAFEVRNIAREKKNLLVVRRWLK